MQNREKYAKIGRGAAFHEAVKQTEEYISDPIVREVIFNRIEVE